MDTLSYKTLASIGYSGYLLKDAPEKVLQFGEGNFLRAFVDYFIDVLNERTGFSGKVVLSQPIANGLSHLINKQEGLYTLYLRGTENGKKISRKRIISSVSRCINPYDDYQALLDCAHNPDLRFIVSNTTEAGIVFDPASTYSQTPPDSFPAKLTRFLHERYLNKGKGFIILSCELIDDNGKELQRCVDQYIDLWGLDQDFKMWVKNENQYCSTLVDRIVTGYPRNEAETLNLENGYIDQILNTGESFGFWVIEGNQSILEEMPFNQTDLPVLVTDNHKPYKQQKVRILNGAHTTMVLAAYLAGHNLVRDCMKDDVIREYMNHTIYDEIIPSITSLPENQLKEFASSVEDRFANPYIDHQLLSIALNSTSKWRARVLPSLLEYLNINGNLPKSIVFSYAAYIAFYQGGEWSGNRFFAKRGPDEYEICDDKWILDFFSEHKNDTMDVHVKAICGNTRMWGMDLNALPGFPDKVTDALRKIETMGIREAMADCLK